MFQARAREPSIGGGSFPPSARAAPPTTTSLTCKVTAVTAAETRSNRCRSHRRRAPVESVQKSRKGRLFSFRPRTGAASGGQKGESKILSEKWKTAREKPFLRNLFWEISSQTALLIHSTHLNRLSLRLVSKIFWLKISLYFVVFFCSIFWEFTSFCALHTVIIFLFFSFYAFHVFHTDTVCCINFCINAMAATL